MGHWTKGKPSSKRGVFTTGTPVPPGTLCGCGCGQQIPERFASGQASRKPASDGKYYLYRHWKPKWKGETVPGWKGGRYITPKGYVMAYAPDHPHNRKGYVFEHRLVMEKKLGRLLLPTEIVHHINGDRADNAEDNLKLVESQSTHVRQHGTNPNAMSTHDARVAAGRKGAEARWGKRDHS